MKLKALILGAATAAFLAVPTIASAAWGQVTGSVNMRTGPSPGYQRITTLPAGARVWVNGPAGNGWVSISYSGQSGFVSGSYIASSGIAIGEPYPGQRPPFMHRSPPPGGGYWHKPWWDGRYSAWYDGRRWYRNGVWFTTPPGFTFGFTFGG